MRIRSSFFSYIAAASLPLALSTLEENGCPFIPPVKIDFTFDEEFIVAADEAVKLNIIALKQESGPIEDLIEEQRKVYAIFNGWSDIDDQAVVAKTKTENICYAVFGATEFANLLDQWQNISPFFRKIEDTDCYVRRSYYSAYMTMDYFEEFRQELESCLASCGETPCKLVISGYSQAAGPAVVAAIDLREHNPLVLTFGSTQAIIPCFGDCPEFNAANHYIFVNTINGYYDQISMQPNPLLAKHLGQLLLLDEKNLMIGYPGLNAGTGPRSPTSLIAHDPGLYVERIAFLRARGCFPVPVGKWPLGHQCNYDDECDSLNCAKNGVLRECQSS